MGSADGGARPSSASQHDRLAVDERRSIHDRFRTARPYNEVAMSDELENLKSEDLSDADRPLVDSARAADPPAAGHGPLSEFVHAAGRGARRARSA